MVFKKWPRLFSLGFAATISPAKACDIHTTDEFTTDDISQRTDLQRRVFHNGCIHDRWSIKTNGFTVGGFTAGGFTAGRFTTHANVVEWLFGIRSSSVYSATGAVRTSAHFPKSSNWSILEQSSFTRSSTVALEKIRERKWHL
jgi:hypothetical protein